MPTSTAFTITLPLSTADFIYRRVADGRFENVSEYLEALVVGDMLGPIPSEEELVRWMKTEGARRVEAMRTEPSLGLSIDEAFADLIDEESGEEING